MSNERKNIPKAAARITKHIFKPGINKYASGDLEEEFKLVVKESGRKKALIWYWKQVLLSLFPYIRDGISNSMMLFMNYMRLASRNLLKHKGYSLINIFGLTFGIACCLLMALAFTYGLSYDRFHENYSRLFRVRETQHYTDHTETNYYTVSPLGPTLKENFPEIIDATRIAYQGEMLLRYEDAKFFESDGIAVGKSFFDMLTFPFIKGDMATALNDPNSIVLNESIAEKLFGDIDPIGKILKVNNRYDLMVTGVFQDVKMNSTYQFSFVLPWEYMKNYEWFQEDRWDNHNHPTFVLLDENTQVVELEKKIINIFDEHSGEDALTVEISLQSFPDMCFYTEINGMTGMDSGLIFGFLALFILLISCINFMNLTTARSAFRYKEIGIRKVVGCSRRNIIIQFFSESLMLSFISLIVAIILIEPSLMIINSKMGMDLTLNFVSNWWMLAAMLGIAFVTGIISGSYPAFYLSSFSPLNIIKGTFNSGKRKPVMRRLLVSVQLGLTIIFLITGFVSSRQFDFLMNHDMGWERENLIYIRMRGESEKSIGILKTELAKIPGVNKVSAGYCLPYAHYSSTTGIKWPDKNPEEKISLRYNFVDPEYMDILNLEMVEGKSFSKELMDESSSYVINETLARIIGIEPIIGTEIEFWGNPGRIIGVVKDFHTRSLRTDITPIIMMIRNYDEMNYTLIKLNPENTSSIMENISETWKSVLPEYPIEYGFIEDDLYNMYNDEGAMGIMMKGITIFTLLITCLGLMALVAFMTEKRKKEIGVRKVLGSSIPAIIKLISREFSALLTVTNVLACLAAYFLMKAFLGTYAYRTEIVWNEFILSCLLISAVAMLTISYQTFKAARANPVDTLRND